MIRIQDILLVILVTLLAGCGSAFTSMKQVRNREPMRTVVVPLPFDDAYANLSKAVSECVVLNINKAYSVKRSNSAEVAVLSNGAVSGSNVWLAVIVEPINDNESRLSIYWSKKFWESRAASIKSWAMGASTGC